MMMLAVLLGFIPGLSFLMLFEWPPGWPRNSAEIKHIDVSVMTSRFGAGFRETQRVGIRIGATSETGPLSIALAINK